MTERRSAALAAIPRVRTVLAGLVLLCGLGGVLAYWDLNRAHGPVRRADAGAKPVLAPLAPPGTRPEAVAGPVPPTFDVVRVSPQGTAVIAGRAGAGSEVIVFDGGQEVARAMADRRGEFVALPSLPLAAGGRELTLVARPGGGGAEIRGDQSVVLVVPDFGKPDVGKPGAGKPGVGKPGAAEAPVVALLDPHGTRMLQQPELTAEAPAGAKAGPGRVSLDVVDYDEAGAVRFSGRAAPGAGVRVYVDNGVVGDVAADGTGRWALVPERAIAAGVHTLRADALDQAGRVAARVELPFQRAATTVLAVDRGRVVVQPGENLWRLARAAYGSGVRYTVIYEANQGQIRDPRLIYPGQAFAMPPGARP